MRNQFWLVKQEPSDFSWSTLMEEGKTAWTGVRNFQARNNLRAMKKNDLVLFYHSGDEKQIVGIAKVAREAYPDPTADEGDWSCVDIAAVKPLKTPVTLTAIKGDKTLSDLLLVRHSRLSVMPVEPKHWQKLLSMADTRA